MQARPQTYIGRYEILKLEAKRNRHSLYRDSESDFAEESNGVTIPETNSGYR
jgi:hypothetical protein